MNPDYRVVNISGNTVTEEEHNDSKDKKIDNALNFKNTFQKWKDWKARGMVGDPQEGCSKDGKAFKSGNPEVTFPSKEFLEYIEKGIINEMQEKDKKAKKKEKYTIKSPQELTEEKMHYWIAG